MVIHDSVDEAERSLEAQDVRDGVYRAYDATGRRLVLRPVSRPPSGRGPEVEIELASDGETHEDELRELLLNYLSSRTGEKSMCPQATCVTPRCPSSSPQHAWRQARLAEGVRREDSDG